MIKILDKYVIREFLVSYLISFAALVGLRVVVDLFMNLDEFTEQAVTFGPLLGHILSYYGCQVFVYFEELAGAITLVAATFALVRMNRNHETVAVLVSGVSLQRLAAPLVLMGVLMNALLLADREIVIPRLAHLLVRRPDDAPGTRPFPVKLMTDRNHSLIYAFRLYPAESRMKDVAIFLRDKHSRGTGMLVADEAFWEDQSGGWRLTRGILIPIAPSNVGETKPAFDKPRKALLYRTDLDPEEMRLRQSSGWLRFMSSRELDRMVHRPYLAARLSGDIQTERHFRFTQPIINIIMILLGIPFIISRQPRSFKHSAGACMAVTGICFVVTLACEQLSGVAMAPLHAAWLPVLLFGPLSILTYDAMKS